jgi:hypothetical protein
MVDSADDSKCYEYDDEVEEMVDNRPMFITNRIYLGSIDAALNTEALRSKNIRWVLSLLHQNDDLNPVDSSIHYLRVKMDDTAAEPLFTRLPFLIHCINEFLRQGDVGNVLVHWYEHS